MKNEKIEIKNELLYLFLLVLITEIFFDSVFSAKLSTSIIIGLVGFLLLEVWFAVTFDQYSKKKISKYSNVLMKISLKKRFFSYFVLPGIFYLSLLVFLFYNRNILLGHFVLGMCMILLLVLFLNVKSSMRKFYTIHIATKAIFDFMCITTLYLLLNAFLRIGFSMIEFLLLSFTSSFILYLFVLKLHDRFGGLEILFAIASSIFVSASLVPFWNRSVFMLPAVGALSFYLIISLWNIRFSGKVKLSDYLAPVLYVLFALALIFTI